MPNLILVVLIAVFFLRKSSKEIDEKTQNSSFGRTFFYFLLTVIFAIFYYRSFQVGTIVNHVTISSLRGFEDSLHNSRDTIERLQIYNNFKTFGSYRNQYFEALRRRNNDSIIGGVAIEIQNLDILPDSIKDRSGLNDVIRENLEKQTYTKIDSNTGEIFYYDFISTSIPNFIPICSIKRFDNPNIENTVLYSKIDSIGNCTLPSNGNLNLAKSNLSEGYYYDALKYSETMVAHTKGIKLLGTVLPHSQINTINLFTAADLSQYTYVIELESDMYVKKIRAIYNVPIEIDNQSDVLQVYSNGFGIDNDDIHDDLLSNGILMFHVKLPTMQNLQEIRSLILTAIVTALFSLFFTNLFYRLRKSAKDYILKKELTDSEESLIRAKAQNIKLLLRSFAFVLVMYVVVLAIFAIFDYVFLVDFENSLGLFCLKQTSLIVILSIPLYYLTKKINNYFQKKKDK